MRSKSKSAAACLLIVIGRGLAAGFAPDLVWHLQQGGFETRIALTHEAEGWAAPETLHALSGAPVLFHEPLPAWAGRTESYAATIAVGFSASALSDLVTGVARSPAGEFVLRHDGPLFVLHEAFSAESSPILRSCASRGYALRELPPLPGKWRTSFESLLSDLVLLLSRRNSLASFPVEVSRSVPEALAALAGDPPAWISELKRHLRGFGFPDASTPPGASTRLLIETYEGPYPLPLKKSRGTVLSVTLDPAEAGPAARPAPDALCVRFVHPDAPETGVRALAEAGTIAVRRQPHGHLCVTDAAGDRLLPNLSAQPAFLRLAEFLADRLARSAG